MVTSFKRTSPAPQGWKRRHGFWWWGTGRGDTRVVACVVVRTADAEFCPGTIQVNGIESFGPEADVGAAARAVVEVVDWLKTQPLPVRRA